MGARSEDKLLLATLNFGNVQGDEWVIQTRYLLACVASVSNRVTARKLEREQNKKKIEFLHSPPPPPSFLLFFCCRPNFLDELARKRLLRRLVICVTFRLSGAGYSAGSCAVSLRSRRLEVAGERENAGYCAVYSVY